MPRRTALTRLNNFCNVKHIKLDFGLGGAQDEVVFEKANAEKRILITYNKKDFKPLTGPESMTIIGVSPHLSDTQLDLKLYSLIRKMKPADQMGQYISINR